MDNSISIVQDIVRITKQLKLISRLIFSVTLFNLMLFIGHCSNKVYTEESRISIDTSDVRVIPVAEIEGLSLSIGQSIKIPSLGVDITRFSEKEAVVSYPVRVNSVKRTAFVSTSTKNVDKSRTVDKSKVKTVDKSKVKILDNDKDKTVTTTKTKTGASVPWWLWLLLILSVIIYLGWRNRSLIRKLFFPL